jgi:TonB-linked SusC/RagA family outer membrane protein
MMRRLPPVRALSLCVLVGITPLMTHAQLYALSAQKARVFAHEVPLRDVLLQLKERYQVDILFEENQQLLVRGALLRDATLEQNLDHLLASTGLRYRKVKKDTYILKQAAPEVSFLAQRSNALPPEATPIRLSPARTELIVAIPPVKGKVTDRATGQPLVGVSVLLKGTGQGTSTNAAGEFTLSLAESQGTLLVSSIGYQTEEIPLGGRTSLAISLAADTKALGEVVVTALGIKREQKALGYSVAQIDGAELSNVKSPNMLNALAGKVAGVNIVSTSTDAGSTALITIRGQSSISKDNQPLFVVDGIPVAPSLRTPNMAIGRSVTDYGSPIGDINPDDIESVTILKGASAAALYGSRAGSGVVLITTKTGSKARKGLGVTVNSTTMFDKIWQYPEFQNQFGTGDFPGTANTVQGSAWGPRLDVGTKKAQWNSPLDASGNRIPTDWVSYPNRISDFFRVGTTFTNNLAVTSNGEKGSFRLSYTNLSNNGVVPNTGLKRNSLDLAANYKLHDRVRISTNVGYTNNSSANRAAAYRESVTEILYKMPANVDLRPLRNYWKPGREGFEQFTYDPGNLDNPYLVAYEETNGYRRNRIIGNVQAFVDITKDLSLMVRTGMDFYAEEQDLKRPFSGKRTPLGGYYLNNLFFTEHNSDFLLSYKKTLTPDWQFSASVGANRMDQQSRSTATTAGSLVLPGIYNFSNAAAGTVTTLQNNTRKRINSIYGTAEVSYKNMLFLNVTGRNDWSSTLPSQNNSFFYPSFSLSSVVTDMLKMQSNVLTFAKVRANWSQVGSDTDPYQLYNTLLFDTDWGTVKRPNLDFALKNSLLKPEIATSYELGTDLRFFRGGRIGLEFTWYKTNNRNQIIKIPTTIAAGSSTRLVNAGNIQNEGIEIGVRAVPIDAALRWEISANYTRNINKVIKLIDGLTEYSMGSADGDNIRYLLKEGTRIGDMYTPSWIKVPDGPYKGQPLLTSAGLLQRQTTYDYLGNYNPDFSVGFNNTFTYKNLTLNFLIDWRQGGKFYSYPMKTMILQGTSALTLRGRDAETGGLAWTDGERRQRNDGMIVQGYIANGDGTYRENTNILSASAYYDNLYNKYYERTTYDASFVKLREASLTYQFGKKVLSRLPVYNLSVSLIGRNLFNWTACDNGFDPETSMSVAEDGFRRGVGHWTLPGVRSYGFKLGFQF